MFNQDLQNPNDDSFTYSYLSPGSRQSQLFSQEDELFFRSPRDLIISYQTCSSNSLSDSSFMNPLSLLDFQIQDNHFINDATSYLISPSARSYHSRINSFETWPHQNSQSIQIYEQIVDQLHVQPQADVDQISQAFQIEQQEENHASSEVNHLIQAPHDITQLINILIQNGSWQITPKRFEKLLRNTHGINDFSQFFSLFSKEMYAYLSQQYRNAIKSKKEVQDAEESTVGQKRSRHYQDIDEYEHESNIFFENIKYINNQLSEIKETAIQFRQNFKKELEVSQVSQFEDLKAKIVKTLAKNRNKITARQSRLKKKNERQEFEIMNQNTQQLIQKIIQNYKQKLVNSPLQLSQILQNITSLQRELTQKLNNLQSQ